MSGYRMVGCTISMLLAIYLGCTLPNSYSVQRPASPENGAAAGQTFHPSPGLYSSTAPASELIQDVPTPSPEPMHDETAPAPGGGLPKHFRELSLNLLDPELAAYLQEFEGNVGVAVVVPGEGSMYSWNGHSMFYTASLIKVVIMAAAMSQAEQEGQGLTPEELSLVHQMVEWSDNDAADILWNKTGGSCGIGAFLQSLGIKESELDSAGFWGDSRFSPADLALFLSKLARGDVLDPPLRDLSLDLMANVDPSQAWGVTAGIPPRLQGAITVGVKNGWYPRDDGWVVNSGGIISAGDRSRGYSIVVMTSGQPTMEDGIGIIEHTAASLHSQLLKRLTSLDKMDTAIQ